MQSRIPGPSSQGVRTIERRVTRHFLGDSPQRCRRGSLPGSVAIMGQIIYETATSLDGYLADPAKSLLWLFAVPGGDDPRLAPPRAAVQVMGSTTYEWVLNELGAVENMDAWGTAMPEVQTVVFTTRNLSNPGGAAVHFMSGEVAAALPQLREMAGNGIIWVVGGGGLASQFIAARALDEMVLSVAPVALIDGAPLLEQRIESNLLHLVEAQHIGQFARLRYRLTYPDQQV